MVEGAVTTLMTPATTADADVQAFTAKLLTSSTQATTRRS